VYLFIVDRKSTINSEH